MRPLEQLNRQRTIGRHERQVNYVALADDEDLPDVDRIDDFQAFDRMADDFLGELLVVEAGNQASQQEHLAVALNLQIAQRVNRTG